MSAHRAGMINNNNQCTMWYEIFVEHNFRDFRRFSIDLPRQTPAKKLPAKIYSMYLGY